MNGLHGGRHGSGERQGLEGGAIKAGDGHDHDRRWQDRHFLLLGARDDERVVHRLVVVVDPVEQRRDEGDEHEDHPRAVLELRVRDDQQDRPGHHRPEGVDGHRNTPAPIPEATPPPDET